MYNRKVGGLSGAKLAQRMDFPILPPLTNGVYQAHLDPDAWVWVEDNPPTKEVREIQVPHGQDLRMKLRGDLRVGSGFYELDISELGRGDFFRFISPFNRESKRGTDLPHLIRVNLSKYGTDWVEFELLEPVGRMNSGRRFSELLAVLYDCKWSRTGRGGSAWSITAQRVLIRG